RGADRYFTLAPRLSRDTRLVLTRVPGVHRAARGGRAAVRRRGRRELGGCLIAHRVVVHHLGRVPRVVRRVHRERVRPRRRGIDRGAIGHITHTARQTRTTRLVLTRVTRVHHLALGVRPTLRRRRQRHLRRSHIRRRS